MKLQNIFGIILSLNVICFSAEIIIEAPADKAENVSCFPDLLWKLDDPKNSGVLADYQIQIASDAAFENIAAADTVELARFVPPAPLASGKTFYWRVRPAGAAEWSSVWSFTVADFSNYVVSITAKDSTEQIRRMFNDIRQKTPATVRLAEDVQWGADDVDFLNLRGFSNLWFDGNGKTITVTNPSTRLFHVFNSTNIIFSDFTVDYNPICYTLCEITSKDINKNQITVRSIINDANSSLEMNHPLMLGADRPHFRILDKEHPGAVKFGEETYFHSTKHVYIDSVEENGQLFHNFQITAQNQTAADFVVGDLMLRVGRWTSRNILRAFKTQHIAFYNVTAYSSPGQFMNNVDGSGMIVINCNVELKEGRYSSVTADVLYSRRNEIGPWVYNCRFISSGDDSMNFHSLGATVKAKKDSRTLEMIVRNEIDRFSPGDRVAIWDAYPGTAEPFYTTVESINPSLGTVTFAEPLKGIDLSDKTPVYNTLVFNLTKSNRRFLVKNSLISNNARFGMIIASQDGAVINNTFERCASSAIQIGTDPAEGLNAGNILIRGNLFKNCGYTTGYFDTQRAALQIASYATHWKNTPWKLQKNIQFIDNVIEGWESAAVRIEGVAGVLFSNNTISAGAKTGFTDRSATNAVFIIGNASDITITGNQLTDSRRYDRYLIEHAGVTGLKIEPEKRQK